MKKEQVIAAAETLLALTRGELKLAYIATIGSDHPDDINAHAETFEDILRNIHLGNLEIVE